jgi:hypothetical protein
VTAFRIIGLVVAAHSVLLDVAVGAEVHQVVVTVGGADRARGRVPAGRGASPVGQGGMICRVKHATRQGNLGGNAAKPGPQVKSF